MTFNKSEKERFFDAKIQQVFELQEVVYASSLKQYVTLKDFDEKLLGYKCKIREHAKDMKNYVDEIKEEEAKFLEQDKLTKVIRLNVRI